MKKISLLVDVDPGIDDFFALAVVLGNPEYINVLGISTVVGNCTIDVTTRNALDSIKLLGCEHIPVVQGFNKFYTHEFGEFFPQFHGYNCLGDLPIIHSKQQTVNKDVCDFIYEKAKECNGELQILAVAPLTNIAKTIEKYPDITKLIKKITIMGGSTTKGNVNEYAEANIWNDAEAANIVFSSNIPIDMIGLNITLNSPLPRDTFDMMLENVKINDDLKIFMQCLIDFRKGEPMHDAVAAACLIDDSFITFKDAQVNIIYKDKIKYGHTAIDYNIENDHNVRVAVDIDLNKYYDIIKKTLRNYQND